MRSRLHRMQKFINNRNRIILNNSIFQIQDSVTMFNYYPHNVNKLIENNFRIKEIIIK